MRFAHLLLSSAVALTLAACARTDGIATVSQVDSRFDSDDYAHEASVKPILVVVRGSAFGLDQRSLEQVVTSNMQGADWSPHARLTTVPSNDVAKIFSYVMLVNGPSDLTAAALCRDPARIPVAVQPTPTGEVRLVGGLCRYDQDMVEVTGRLDGLSGPQDPRFRGLIAAAMQEMTSPKETEHLLLHNHDSDGGGSNK
jgi:hypothetical protein